MKRLKDYCSISTILFIFVAVVNVGGIWFWKVENWFFYFSILVAANYLISGLILASKLPKKIKE